MNRLLLVTLVAATCLWSTTSFSQTTPRKKTPANLAAGTNTQGRYQLFQGSYFADGTRLDGVFMIDSETGRTWVYSQKATQGKGWDYYAWIPIAQLKVD